MAKTDLRLKTMKARLETMDFYIDAGRSLNDAIGNNNFDKIEIYRFFRPIDRLFGDYEVRQRQGIENFLYRRNTQGETVKILRAEIDKQTAEGKLLLLIICQNQASLDLRVNYGWIKIDRSVVGKQATIKYDGSAETALTVDPKTVKHIYVLEPTKLRHAIYLDNDRIKAYNEAVFGPPSKEKNLKPIKEIAVRLGQYEDGRYVLYLHPYWSESNCPIRIPAE